LFNFMIQLLISKQYRELSHKDMIENMASVGTITILDYIAS